MTSPRIYLLDSDVFIAAKNSYYAFDLCPGFWECLVRAHRHGRIASIDRVRNELLAGRKDEDLVKWVKKELPAGFFHGTDASGVPEKYGEILLWVQRHPRLLDRAKVKSATEADAWLVAYSVVKGTIVVTNEQSRPEARNEVKLPDLCENFKVPYVGTFSMLRDLAVRFELSPVGR